MAPPEATSMPKAPSPGDPNRAPSQVEGSTPPHGGLRTKHAADPGGEPVLECRSAERGLARTGGRGGIHQDERLGAAQRATVDDRAGQALGRAVDPADRRADLIGRAAALLQGQAGARRGGGRGCGGGRAWWHHHAGQARRLARRSVASGNLELQVRDAGREPTPYHDGQVRAGRCAAVGFPCATAQDHLARDRPLGSTTLPRPASMAALTPPLRAPGRPLRVLRRRRRSPHLLPPTGRMRRRPRAVRGSPALGQAVHGGGV